MSRRRVRSYTWLCDVSYSTILNKARMGFRRMHEELDTCMNWGSDTLYKVERGEGECAV